MEEIWKDIPGYEGLYQASNLGRIKSCDKIVKRKKKGNFFKKGTILKLQLKDNYYHCKLSKNNIKPTQNVHKIIATTFIDKYNFKTLPDENRELINIEDLVVNHKNEIKTDNRADNLEWCSIKYNNCYGNKIKNIKNKLIGRKHTIDELKKMSISHMGIEPKNKGKKRIYISDRKYIYG